MLDKLHMLIIAPIIFFILYFFINNYAIKLGLYDKNEFKKNRNNYISLTGGIYIFFSLILVSTFILPYDKLYFITLSSFGIFLMGLVLLRRFGRSFYVWRRSNKALWLSTAKLVRFKIWTSDSKKHCLLFWYWLNVQKCACK